MTRPRQCKTILQLLVGSTYTLRHTILISSVSGFEKESRRKARFGSNTEIKEAFKRFFHMQRYDFTWRAFLKRIKSYDKCLNVLGTYVEK
ncbi:hypothetical protein TNCV_437881 [Trichonephila clavipes]|nr:hypothetical protein TNCV_437881 [Trichonephila clavipes]